jgi:hypothetical protein
MGILKAKELNKTPVASARELKVLSGDFTWDSQAIKYAT